MKKRFFAILITILLVCSCSPALASEQRVFDQAGLLSGEESAALESRIAELRAAYDHDFAILTADAGVYDTADYADIFYEEQGFGAGDGNSGVLFFVDMENRTTYISTTGTMIDIIDDAREEAIFDAQMDYLGEGAFGDALMASLDMAEEYILDGVAGDHYAYDEETGGLLDPSEYGSEYQEPTVSRLAMAIVGLIFGSLLGLVAGLITRAVIKGSYNKKYKPAKYDFNSKSSLSLTVNDSRITNKAVTTRRIPREDTNRSSGGGFSGGSSRSGVHRSSSGARHGGGGRKF